tara:strand:- start:405 stop:1868 length:1464 start_codon:yes stop_codon:yes gene_type:complete
MFKKKYILITFLAIFSMSFIVGLAIFDDKRDNIPDSIERFIPSSVKKFLVENIFYKKKLYASIERLRKRVSNKDKELKSENKIVDKLLDELYSMGLSNLKFFKVKNEEQIISKNSKIFKISTFQTDYLSIGTWPHTKASAYLDIYENQIFLVSKNGIISFFNIDSIENEKFEAKILQSNIKEIVNYEGFYSHGGKGIKDILIDKNRIFVTYSNLLSKDCYNTSILVAEINFEYLNFEKYFDPPSCVSVRKGYNRWSDNAAGGRLVKFKDDNYLFSHGGFKTRVKAQDDSSVVGKILKINNLTKNWNIISKGHRNVQGLFYDEKGDFILSTEHGPQGGDEINLNNLKNNTPKNFGWPISSYGEHYGGKSELNSENYKEAPLHKSHSEYGFIEPIKHFVPSIGITEIKKIPIEFNFEFINDYFIGSMGNNLQEGDLSIHQIRLNMDNNEIIYSDILGIGERVRDILFIEKINKFILFLENTASIAILEN